MPASGRHYRYIHAQHAIIPHMKIYLVGGAVRDRLLQRVQEIRDERGGWRRRPASP